MLRKQVFAAAVIGGVVGAVLTIFALQGLVLPLGAHEGDVSFGTVTCRELNVVDKAGDKVVWLWFGGVNVFGDEGMVSMSVQEHGGQVLAISMEDKVRGAKMSCNEHGGGMMVFGKVDNADNIENAVRVVMGVDEYGNGAVDTWDKNGYRLATLK